LGYILTVDDEPNIRQLLSLVLKRNGYRVKTAGDGSECLAIAASEPPALVLLDLQMPGMNGVEVLRELRSRLATRRTPVVIISGSTQLLGRASTDHVDGYLEKPFDLDRLLEVVRDLYPQEEDGRDGSLRQVGDV